VTFSDFVKSLDLTLSVRLKDTSVERCHGQSVAEWRKASLWCRVFLKDGQLVESVLGVENSPISWTARTYSMRTMNAMSISAQFADFLVP
jgi:hypothetical protein